MENKDIMICEECGGIMDYYDDAYCCRICGNMKEI